MNFLNFLTSGANLFNFNLQNLSASSGLLPQIKNKTKDSSNQEQQSQGQPNSSEVQDQIKILNQQQLLINQYMHMNIQLLNHKLQCLEKQPKEQKAVKFEKGSEEEEQSKQPRKKTKKIIKCGHEDKPHYAKGLCNNCYHKFGRNKKPWKCGHSKLYAAGLCQNCYINNYNKKKRQRVKQEGASSEQYISQKIQVKCQEQVQKQ